MRKEETEESSVRREGTENSHYSRRVGVIPRQLFAKKVLILCENYL
jgi:hypothetical protein